MLYNFNSYMLYFIALLDRSPDLTSMEWLVERLALNPPAVAGFVAEYTARYGPKVWEISHPIGRGNLSIHGPYFSIRFEPGLVHVCHSRRYSAFTSDASYRDRLRHLCLYLAGLTGSDRAIYTHELMGWSGESLDEIGAGLSKTIGPPARSFEELHEAGAYAPGSWYVDDFADLRR